jgi:alkanesulfonate monooxygenase SsuD/methylene tetrahydromethanopterin reductase-like flavin-dependent oxidoreductase (luciferase family)
MRPFRFLATAGDYGGLAELTSLARKAEAVGCSAFVVPDHLIGQYAAMPLLAVVAHS